MEFFTDIDSFVIDRRLNTIYRAIKKNDTLKAVNTANETIRLIKSHTVIDCDKSTVNYFIEILYRTLIDLARGRMTEAHCKVRDCHYYILNKDMHEQREFEEMLAVLLA